MKIICWNARGLGNQRAFRTLRNLVTTRNPQILFISETKCGAEPIEKIIVKCKFDVCLTIKSIGAKGGICLLWKDPNQVSINSYSQNHIDTTITWCNRTWRFIGIYGFPKTNQKNQTWNLLRRLNCMGTCHGS